MWPFETSSSRRGRMRRATRMGCGFERERAFGGGVGASEGSKQWDGAKSGESRDGSSIGCGLASARLCWESGEGMAVSTIVPSATKPLTESVTNLCLGRRQRRLLIGDRHSCLGRDRSLARQLARVRRALAICVTKNKWAVGAAAAEGGRGVMGEEQLTAHDTWHTARGMQHAPVGLVETFSTVGVLIFWAPVAALTFAPASISMLTTVSWPSLAARISEFSTSLSA